MTGKLLPKYAMHKPTGQARVRIDGRDIYLGTYGTKKSYQRYSEELANWQSRADEDLEDITVRQLTMLYNEFAKGHYRKNGKPTSKLSVVQTAMRHLNRQFRDLPASELTPKRFKAVRQTLIDDNLARTTINDYMACIRRMVRWAVGEELLGPERLVAINAVADLQENRSGARETEPVEAVANAYVDAVKGHVAEQVWAMIELQRLTGMRPGEVRIMRACDLIVTGAVWEYRPHSHKMEHKKKQRVVCIGPKAQKILKPWLRAEMDAYLFGPAGSDGSRPYSKDAYCRAIVRGCEVAYEMPEELRKIDPEAKDIPALKRKAAAWRAEHCWSPNQLRHNFATAARKEFGIEGARVTLGHSSAVTSEIYAEVDYDAARAVVAKIG